MIQVTCLCSNPDCKYKVVVNGIDGSEIKRITSMFEIEVECNSEGFTTICPKCKSEMIRFNEEKEGQLK